MKYIQYKFSQQGGRDRIRTRPYNFKEVQRYVNEKKTDEEKKQFTLNDAQEFINYMRLDMSKELFKLNDVMNGMNVELEHGTRDKETDVTGDNLITTGKIALAHLREFPDYYQRLEKMEKEGERHHDIYSDIKKISNEQKGGYQYIIYKH